MKLDGVFSREIEKVGNGDGSREYKFAFDKEIQEVSRALEDRYGFDDCLKKYGRAKVALCVAATIMANDYRFEAPQKAWARAVLSLWTNIRFIESAHINIHPAILASNSSSLRKVTVTD
jgi:hypothetical protein